MEEPLEDVQDRILERLVAGERVDREAEIAAHPAHAEPLRRFFDVVEEIEAGPRPRPAGPAPGSLGEFRILREIGRGGMGVVYEAEQESLKRRVALKVLPPSMAGNPRVVARFRREAEAAGRLRHPGIVPVYSVGEAAGTPFFAMELVGGRSLASVIAERAAGRDAGLPPAGEPWRRWVAETLGKVAEALAHAHGEGILHRDVKPANILLEGDGTPRLTDFGLALDLGAPGLTASGETFGTPLYMSPEQAVRRDAPLDPRTDVYSLGVTLYEALTLRTPYAGVTAVEVLAALHRGEVVPPREADPGIPAALESVVLRALRKEPAERYPSAAAMAEDLRAVLENRPVRPAPAAPAAPGPRRRGLEIRIEATGKPTGRGLAVAGILLALAGTGIVLWNRAHRDGPPPGGSPGTRAPGVALTAADLVLLADGRMADGERVLREWCRPRASLLGVVSREGDLRSDRRYEVVLDGAPTARAPDGAPSEEVLVLGFWEASVDGGPWTELGFTASTTSARTSRLSVRLATLLWAHRGKDSVVVLHRMRARALRRPEGYASGALTPADHWKLPAGTTCTWTDEPFLVRMVDEFPPDYPEFVRDGAGAADAAMRASLTPAFAEAVERLGGGGQPFFAFRLRLADLGPPGPLPAAMAIELRHPATGVPLGTAQAVRGEGGDLWIDCIHPPTTAAEDDPSWEALLRPGAKARLSFRPSREAALEDRTSDRYWGGAFEVEVPLRPPAGMEAAPAAPAAPAPEPAPAPAPARPEAAGVLGIPEGEFLQLIDGTHPDGAAALARWMRAGLRFRPVLARKDIDAYSPLLQVEIGRVAPRPDPLPALFLSVIVEASGDGDRWREVHRELFPGFSTTTSLLERAVPAGKTLGEEALEDAAEVRLRVKVRVGRSPPEKELRDWKGVLPGSEPARGTDGVLECGARVRLVEEYPEDYPAAVSDAATATALRRGLTPQTVAWDHLPNAGMLRSFGSFNLECVVPGPLPVAFAGEADLADPRTGGVAARWRPFVLDPAEMREWPRRLVMAFRTDIPVPKDVEAFADEILRGEVPSIRVTFRSSREAARRNLAFHGDRVFEGEFTLEVPVKGKAVRDR